MRRAPPAVWPRSRSAAAGAPPRSRPRSRRARCSRRAGSTGARGRTSRPSTTSTRSSRASRAATRWTTRCSRSAAITWRWTARRAGARRLRPGGQALPAERRRSRRLLLPRLADPGARHRPRPSWTTRWRSSTACSACIPGSEWVPRALYAAGLAHRGRGGWPRPRSRSAARRSSTRPARRRRPRSSRSAMPGADGRAAPGDGGVPAGPQPLPELRVGGPRPGPHHGALSPARRRREPAFARDAGFQLAAGDVLKDVRALLMTPARRALDRQRQGARARCPSTPPARWARACPPRSCAAWRWGRAARCW